MRRLAGFVLFSASCWAGCAAHTYTVGTGKDYPGVAGVANALAAVKTACGSDPFSGSQIISVYATGGPYTAPGDTWHLIPTATYTLWIGAAPGESPVFNCGGSTANLLDLVSSYTTFTGFEITACGSIYGDAPETDVTISYNYFHDIVTLGFGAIQPNTTETNWWVHHNRIVNAPVGIVVNGNALIEYNEVGATTGSSATQISCGSAGAPCTIRNNIVYGAGSQSGSAIWNYYAATVSGNVSYYNRYAFVVENTSSADVVSASYNIGAYNSNTNDNCEGGAGGCWMNVSHDLCLDSLTGSANAFSSSTASSISFTSSISWTDYSLNVTGGNVSTNALNALYSDYNTFMKVGASRTATSAGPTIYATLESWQKAGKDTHTVQTDPKFLGDVALLNTASRLFPECPTIECRLAKIKHNYTPTNLALKGTGCAWNGTTCVPDHSDIGPVPVTVYDAPGITGGGVN